MAVGDGPSLLSILATFYPSIIFVKLLPSERRVHRRVRGGGAPPRRPGPHEEGENSEEIDSVDTISIHSANIASAI